MSRRNGPSTSLFSSASHILISGGTFSSHITQIREETQAATYDRMFLKSVAPSALHDAGHVFDLPRCHPGTRIAVIQAITDWATGVHDDTRDKGILWLTGAAGAGKTAIAKTVCDLSYEDRTLLASYFFQSRDASRNHSRSLIATIAYQICVHYPSILQAVSDIIAHDPLIFSRSLRTQLLSLVISPLSNLHPDASDQPQRRLIVIDGLDECIGRQSQRDILETLAHILRVTPYTLRFLVCSRPESEIANFFSSETVQQTLFKIFLGHEYDPDSDIKRFISERFDSINKNHIFKHLIPDDWPSKRDVEQVVRKSSGQFIYADTVVRYVEDSHYQPHQRLEAVLGLRPPFADLPFAQLDELYTHILSIPGIHERSVDILSFPAIYSEECKFNMIGAILDMDPGDIEVALTHFGSILRMYSDEAQLLHKSFADFLFDSQRSKSFYKNRADTIARHIIRVLQMPLQTCSKWQGYPPDGNARPIAWDGSPAYLLEIVDVGHVDWSSPPYQEAMTSLVEFPMENFCECLFSGETNMGAGFKFLQHFFNTLYRYPRNAKLNEAYHSHLRTFCARAFREIRINYSNDLATNCAFASLYLRRPFDEAELHFFGEKLGPESHPFFYRKDIRDTFRNILTDSEKSDIYARAAAYFLNIICNQSPEVRRSRNEFLQTNRLNRLLRSLTPWQRYRRTEKYFDIHHDYFKSHRYINDNRKRIGGQIVLEASWRLIHHRTSFKGGIGQENASNAHNNRKKACYVSFCYPISKKKKFIVYHRGRYQSRTTHVVLFDYLSYVTELLPLAGRYTPLIGLCRKKAFPALTILLPHRALKARRAITKYLRRNDPRNDALET